MWHTHTALAVSAYRGSVPTTFSKAASLAGLRVGYGVADPDCVALLNRIRQPFNVNSVAQAAALAAIEDDRFDLLPAGAYAANFVRAYAGALGLDPDEMGRRYRDEAGQGEPRLELNFPVPLQESRMPGRIVVQPFSWKWYFQTARDCKLYDFKTDSWTTYDGTVTSPRAMKAA